MDDVHSHALFLEGQWIPVSSSWIDAIRWSRNGRLEVRTRAGKVLYYGGCEAGLFDGFIKAGSQGTFLNVVIKNRLEYLGSS